MYLHQPFHVQLKKNFQDIQQLHLSAEKLTWLPFSYKAKSMAFLSSVKCHSSFFDFLCKMGLAG